MCLYRSDNFAKMRETFQIAPPDGGGDARDETGGEGGGGEARTQVGD